jgi:drug/metabolite transporter (DMT)-like permease
MRGGAARHDAPPLPESTMNTANFLRLLLLAAIWGGSFLFMRIGAPVLGPAVLIEYRVLFAALFLAAVGLVLRKRLDLRANWKHYLMLGFFNSALPFLLFAYGARTLTASVLSVLNATAPMWGALIGALWARQRITPAHRSRPAAGHGGRGPAGRLRRCVDAPGAGMAVAAALAAALCYSIASLYAKSAKSVEPFANAHGTMWAATLFVLPALPFFPSPGQPRRACGPPCWRSACCAAASPT